MEPELKRKWVDALRSGKFEQGKTKLEENGRYCCLGVLRHIVDPKDMRYQPALGGGSLLNGEQLKEYGLTSDEQITLSTINDRGKPFSEIADYIEEHL